jgi:hypothetical protein
MIDDKTQKFHDPNDDWTLRRYAYLPNKVELNMFGSADLGASEPRRLADQLRAAADAIDPPECKVEEQHWWSENGEWHIAVMPGQQKIDVVCVDDRESGSAGLAPDEVRTFAAALLEAAGVIDPPKPSILDHLYVYEWRRWADDVVLKTIVASDSINTFETSNDLIRRGEHFSVWMKRSGTTAFECLRWNAP